MGTATAQAKNQRMNRRSWIGTVALLFFGGIFLFPTAHAATIKVIHLDGDLVATKAFRLSVVVDSQGTALNAAESIVTFPASLLEISSVSQTGIFDHWPVAPVFNNTTGKLQFAGGLPTPGYSGSSGTLLTITFTAKEAGSGNICPTSSRVLANNGLGTDILSGTTCLAITVVRLPFPPAPAITSSTHPDQTLWYNSRNISLSWSAGSSLTGYSYAFDTIADTVPDDVSEGTGQATDVLAPEDGAWFFHVKAQNVRGWGDSAHFRAQIDTVPPVVNASLVGSTPTTDTTPDITYSASDERSGIGRIEAIVDGAVSATLPLNGTQATLPQLAVGNHAVIIRAADVAGNTGDAPIAIEIKSPSIITKIVNTITNAIPQQVKNLVKNVTKPIADVVNNLRTNESIVNTTKQLAEPIAQAAAAIGVAAAVATLPASILNALFSIFRFAYLFFSPIFVRRKRKAWGTVVDAVTGKPIKGVVVRVFETEFNKMKESQITDEYGRFGFLVDPGTYTISAEKQGFTFPSTLFEHLAGLPNIYTGGKITVTDTIHHNINVTIPIDPELSHVTASALLWKRIRDVSSLILERINLPLLVLGTGVSAWATIVVPNTTNYLLLGLYFLLIALKLIRDRSHFRSFGEVFDAETRKPVDLAVVRVFNSQKKALVVTRITNLQGKFEILIRPGKYYLVVAKAPYMPKRTDIMTFSRAKALALDIYLEKAQPKTPPQMPQQPIPPAAPLQPPATPKPEMPKASPPAQQAITPVDSLQSPIIPKPETPPIQSQPPAQQPAQTAALPNPEKPDDKKENQIS